LKTITVQQLTFLTHPVDRLNRLTSSDELLSRHMRDAVQLEGNFRMVWSMRTALIGGFSHDVSSHISLRFREV